MFFFYVGVQFYNIIVNEIIIIPQGAWMCTVLIAMYVDIETVGVYIIRVHNLFLVISISSKIIMYIYYQEKM